MSKSLHGIVEDAKEELLDNLVNYGDWPRYPQDKITEVTDSNVPIYTSDLLRLGARHLHLATSTPELGPAFDGSPTPANIIAANIFEHIQGELYTYLHELEEKRDEYLGDPEAIWDLLQSKDPDDPYSAAEIVEDQDDPDGWRKSIMSDRDADWIRDPLHREDVPLTDDELWDLIVEAAEYILEEEELSDERHTGTHHHRGGILGR